MVSPHLHELNKQIAKRNEIQKRIVEASVLERHSLWSILKWSAYIHLYCRCFKPEVYDLYCCLAEEHYKIRGSRTK